MSRPTLHPSRGINPCAAPKAPPSSSAVACGRLRTATPCDIDTAKASAARAKPRTRADANTARPYSAEYGCPRSATATRETRAPPQLRIGGDQKRQVQQRKHERQRNRTPEPQGVRAATKAPDVGQGQERLRPRPDEIEHVGREHEHQVS